MSQVLFPLCLFFHVFSFPFDRVILYSPDNTSISEAAIKCADVSEVCLEDESEVIR